MNASKKSLQKRYKEKSNVKIVIASEDSMVRSPKHDLDNSAHLAGHSTPLRRTNNNSTVENSPEVEYHGSPILFPCTQDSREVAWDWQSSNASKSNLTETPKRKKFLQKKRNTNSPLLQKGLKRKAKTDNIEELAAELKALTEGMNNLKQNGLSDCLKEEDELEISDCATQLIVELNTPKEEAVFNVAVNNNKIDVNTVTDVKVSPKTESYDELFDDSIDDFMVQCTQAVEEKLNSSTNQESESTNVSGKGNQRNSPTVPKCSTQSVNASKSPSLNVSSCLKTYSKHSSNVSNSIIKDRILSNHQPKNKAKPQKEERNKSGCRKSEIFEIPDDSFDDCLITCLESDKLLSNSSDSDDIFKNMSKSHSASKNNKSSSGACSPNISLLLYNTKSNNNETSNYRMNGNLSKSNATSNTGVSKESSLNENVMENRKFFKTKSLSDQTLIKIGKTSYASRNSNSSSYGSSYASSSTTTTHTVAKGTNQNQWNNNGAASTNRFTKYKSASSLCNNSKETGNQVPITRCTPEEIERKRLEAKMRLEAKRKLQQSTQSLNTQPEVPIKRPVKR